MHDKFLDTPLGFMYVHNQNLEIEIMLRDRPFNLQGGGVFKVVFFRSEIVFRTTEL